MKTILVIDTITYDPSNDEYVLYLVEDGEWPTDDEGWNECLRRIQNRIFDALDTVVDGHLLKQYPDSIGKTVRIQIDSPHGTPEPLHDLVLKIKDYIMNNVEYQEALTLSAFVRDIRIVTGAEMGRFEDKS
jgi:hypothetical protein